MATFKISDLILYKELDLTTTDGEEFINLTADSSTPLTTPKTNDRQHQSTVKSVRFASNNETICIPTSGSRLRRIAVSNQGDLPTVVEENFTSGSESQNDHGNFPLNALTCSRDRQNDRSLDRSPTPSPFKKRKICEAVNVDENAARVAAINAQLAARNRKFISGATGTCTQNLLSRSTGTTAGMGSKGDASEVKAPCNKAAEEFNSMLRSLEQESIEFAENLSNHPLRLSKFLKSLQDCARQVQAMISSQYRVHVLIESAIDNNELLKKHLGWVPIYSSTLLPSAQAGVSGAAIVAAMISESLECSERVASGESSDRIRALDLISSPRSPTITIPVWIPGTVVRHADLAGISRLCLTAIAYIRKSNIIPNEATQQRTGEGVSFVMEPGMFRRVLAPNPTVFMRLMAMNEKCFTVAYKNFMYALYHTCVQAGKITGKIEFERFNPPYFHGQVTLLIPSASGGARVLNSIEFNAPSVPTVHVVEKTRQTARHQSTIFVD